MKLIINIEKKHFYIIVGLISVLSVLLIANGAYVGHTWDDITGGSPILSSLKVTGNVEVDGELNASNGIKIGSGVNDEGKLRWSVASKSIEINNGTEWNNISTADITNVNQFIDMNNHPIENLTDPINPQDAATKEYVDEQKPPICSATDKALQFDGTNWICGSISGAGGSGCGTEVVAWGPSNYCSGSTSPTAHDSSITIISTAHNFGGSIMYICNNGLWNYHSGGTCDFNGAVACFVKDTKIVMEDYSTKNIQQINSGEKVIGFNGKINTVLHRTESLLGKRNTYIINNEVESTGAHLYLSKNKEWKTPNLEAYKTQSQFLGERLHIEPTELKIGDVLIINNKEIIVSSIEQNSNKLESEIVFDLITDGDSTYLTESGYISHGNVLDIKDYGAYNKETRIKSEILKQTEIVK
jgi:hypothetical protein